MSQEFPVMCRCITSTIVEFHRLTKLKEQILNMLRLIRANIRFEIHEGLGRNDLLFTAAIGYPGVIYNSLFPFRRMASDSQ